MNERREDQGGGCGLIILLLGLVLILAVGAVGFLFVHYQANEARLEMDRARRVALEERRAHDRALEARAAAEEAAAAEGEAGAGKDAGTAEEMTAAVLPVLQDVADFAFVDQNGKPLRREDLLGEVWVADFIFTRCAGPCPVMTSRMSILQEEADPRLHLVSVTVDPEYDTTEVLARYAEQAQAEEGRWHFLTGEKKEIYDFSIDSHKLTIEPTERETAIIHSTRFVLIDRKGRVRGYYSGADPTSLDDVERLKKDALLLLEEEG